MTPHKTHNLLLGALLVALSVFLPSCHDRNLGVKGGPYAFACSNSDDAVGLILYSLDGRRTISIPSPAPAPHTPYLRWSPDGTMILFYDRYVVSLPSLEVRTIAVPGQARWWAWDGWHVLVFQPDTGELWEVAPDGQDATMVMDGFTLVEEISVSPDGLTVLWNTYDPETRVTEFFVRGIGEASPRPLTCPGAYGGLGGFEIPTSSSKWFKDGRSVTMLDVERQWIARCYLETNEVTRLVYSEQMIADYLISPDERYLAYAENPFYMPSADIYLVELSNGKKTRLTRDLPSTHLYAWTFDSMYLITGLNHPTRSVYSMADGRFIEVPKPEGTSTCTDWIPAPLALDVDELFEE